MRSRDEDAPIEPAPGLGRIASLVESMERAGLDLACTVIGEPYELAAIDDLTAFRVVQESLTNALKYGTGTADLIIS